MTKPLMRLSVARGGNLRGGRPPVRLLTPDGQDVAGVTKIEVAPFDSGNFFVTATVTLLIEIEAEDQASPAAP